jgi:hypothetical protein
MKNSSVVLLNSKSTLSELEEAFEAISQLAEEELWVSVEFIHGFGSFWGETPEEESEEITGVIDIGDDQEMLDKIMSLVHEIGHAIHSRDKHFKKVHRTMFSESLAWFLGYKWAAKRGFVIDMTCYSEMMNRCLEMYEQELK